MRRSPPLAVRRRASAAATARMQPGATAATPPLTLHRGASSSAGRSGRLVTAAAGPASPVSRPAAPSAEPATPAVRLGPAPPAPAARRCAVCMLQRGELASTGGVWGPAGASVDGADRARRPFAARVRVCACRCACMIVCASTPHRTRDVDDGTSTSSPSGGRHAQPGTRIRRRTARGGSAVTRTSPRPRSMPPAPGGDASRCRTHYRCPSRRIGLLRTADLPLFIDSSWRQ